MKKMIVILALVMVVCAPAMAAVTISGTRVGSTATISYSASGNSIRAFALDISVSTGTISGVTCSNGSYWVYPGSIQISGGSVAGSGTCVCASTYPGTNPGVGTSAVTVEMGSLYTGSNSPASSGTVLTLALSNTAATVTVARNTGRGGVVMENPDESAADNLPITFPISECLSNTATEYNKWSSHSKPNCWCFRRNCRGDADGVTTFGKPVAVSDLNIFKSAYNKLDTQIRNVNCPTLPCICADFDRATTFSKPVAVGDLNRFKSYYNKATTSVPQCDQAPVVSGPYNFWTN